MSKIFPAIEFLGPDYLSMRSLGDKIASLIMAQSVGISTAPWSGSNLVINSNEVDIDTYNKACVNDLNEDTYLKAQNIGYPLMLKASEGGGGKGIRRVESADQLKDYFREVKAESFGSPIFLMKCIENARHLEIQIVADKFGNVATLLGRDCTLQRRHQKLIEEGPIVMADAATCSKLEYYSMKLIKLLKYMGVGTVEFLYLPSSKEYFFLEINPRLQVEHPVTEMITNLNLPAIQLSIASGLTLFE